MIRKSLLVSILLAFASLFLVAPAQAEPHENPSAFWAEQYARGALVQPHPVEAVGDAMRATSRFITRHVDRALGRTAADSSGVTAAAARFIGTNPTGWSHNWCAEFVNRVLRRQGYAGSGSAMALSFAHYGPHVAPRPGAIAVLRGHVGFVESVRGNRIVLVSGNGGRRAGVAGRVTARSIYSRGSFVAFVMPRLNSQR